MSAPRELDLTAPADPPARRRSDRRPGTPPEADRLLILMVMAAMLHGLVILGVRFRADPAAPPEGLGMEVLLVSDELPESRDNPDARYLAQRTQEGSGNTADALAARLPGAPAPEPAASPAERSTAASEAEQDRSLTTTGGAPRTVYRSELLPEPATQASAQPATPVAPLRPEVDTELLLRGRQRDELYVSPDTRAADVAPYLAAWKQRVERVGTINYPSAAQRQGLTGNPVLEVVIGADGQLRAATIRRSSGHAEIDQAALEILRLASPFEPFPAELSARHDQLRFAYEWQFQGGRMSGAVRVP